MGDQRFSQKDAGGTGAASPSLDVALLAGGEDLMDRGTGGCVREAILATLRAVPRGAVLQVDLSRIRQASYAALLEMLSGLGALRSGLLEDRYLLFRVDGDNEEVLELLELIARNHGSVIAAVNTTGAWQMLGRLSRAERDTLAVVLERGEVTTTELRQRFNLLTSAASNRLRRLHDLRLVVREERLLAKRGGREFVYRPLTQAGDGGYFSRGADNV